MPAGSGHFQAADDSVTVSAATVANLHQNQSQTGAADGYSPAQSRADSIKRSGPLHNFSSSSDMAAVRTNNGAVTRRRFKPKIVRDLSEKIDLMPPLSLEPGSKRLILAKKLDRENLEKYLHSSVGSSLVQSSSASLTVHIKCQLKTSQVDQGSTSAALDKDQTVHEQGSMNKNRSSLQLANRTGLDINMSSTRNHNKLGDSEATSNSILIPVHLIITDENDNWPVFSTGPYIIDLNETASIGSLLQNNEILAFDDDQPGPLSTIEYSIVPGSFWSDSFGFLNPLDSRSLIVKDNRLLDYESQPKIALNVMARDQGDPPNWAITTLYVNLLDQDDMNPVFSEDKYQGLIRENRPGEKINLTPKQMMAMDGDRMLSAPIVFSFFMKTNESIHFDLDSNSGQLSLKKSFIEPNPSDVSRSGSKATSFCILIKATQVDNPQRWSLTAVTIGWNDQLMPGIKSTGDNRARTSGFGFTNHSIEISESTPSGTTIFTARANFERGEISYQLLDNELGYLDIDQGSGRLALKKSLDYEMFRSLSVRILATARISDPLASIGGENPYPRLTCDILRLNIRVVNYNDHSPEFSHDLYNFQLSISDLIAKFEQVSDESNQSRFPFKVARENQMSINKSQQGDRFPQNLEQISPGDDTIDEFGHRVIQLGQIYCADRDYGDKVSLLLTGSRASLFHLAEDGRLYLRLTNSSHASSNSTRINLGEGESHLGVAAGKRPALNRVFSSIRRIDENQDERFDRSYLNYLLSELGNMGLLRLKVHASDNGQPEPNRSTALVMISIISIDNFIIQRSPSLSPISGNFENLSGNPNDSISHETNDRQIDSTLDVAKGDSSRYDSEAIPTMMIPSMNGRSYVHINPDIVGNLLSATSNSRMENSKSPNRSIHSNQIDPLESLSSNTVADLFAQRETRLNRIDLTNESNHKPPGLLLVDEDGAKFVAMPTAMEVYNQHVKDASDHQKLRVKFKQQQQQHLADGEVNGKKIPWYRLGNKLGVEGEGGIMQWINISTAIALHLIVIACILSLAVRFKLLFGLSRRYLSGDGGGSDSNFMDHQPDLMVDHNPNNFNRWPKNISNFGSFLVDKQSEPAGSNPVNSISNYSRNGLNSINQCSTYIQHDSYLEGEFDQQISAHQREQLAASEQPKTSVSQQSIVSSGALVKAKSKGQFVEKHSNARNEMSDLSPETKCHQQNLFEHLKLTLDKIMDSDANGETSAIHGATRPNDYSADDSSSQRDRQIDVCAQLEQVNEIKVEAIKRSPVGKSAISTFVGSNANRSNANHHKSLASTHISELDTAQSIVSINVSGPKTHPSNHQLLTSGKEPRGTNSATSSNSSVVSLVSMSSSTLSNKINAAASKTGSFGNNGSDSTSLNSSILLQTCDGVAVGDGSPSLTRKKCQPKVLAKQPPAPPPLPPPPSLVRATAATKSRDVSTEITFPVNKQSKPTNQHAHAAMLVGAERASDALATLQSQPENPTHLRLRRSDQLLSSASNKNDQRRDDDGHRDVDLSSQMHLANSSIDGRREMRSGHQTKAIQRHSQRTRTFTGKPLKQEEANIGKQSTSLLTSSSNKTVSPTTSVDRGYESFQSFSTQSNGLRFASLPDYPEDCGNFECDLDGACVHALNAGRRGAKLSGRKPPVDNRVYRKPMKTNVSRANLSLASQSVSTHFRTRHDTLEPKPVELLRSSVANDAISGDRATRPDCDTEDDDFYYYCCESVQDDEQHQVGCLSYSSHAYQQQIPSAYQANLSGSKSLNYTNRRVNSPRRATKVARSGLSGGRKTHLYKSDLNSQSCNQLGVMTSQICDKKTCEGRCGPPTGHSQQVSDGKSSQIGCEVGVKRLTWSDQVY